MLCSVVCVAFHCLLCCVVVREEEEEEYGVLWYDCVAFIFYAFRCVVREEGKEACGVPWLCCVACRCHGLYSALEGERGTARRRVVGLC